MGADDPPRVEHTPAPLKELALLFLRLGATAFGGPAAHIALLEEEVVRRRAWLTHAEFLDLLGATNMIPGPNSTEMVMHVGHRRAGARGLVVAGICFIAPAVVIVLAIAWAYVRFGSLPAATGMLYGVKPVVIAVVLHALWNLGKTAVKGALEVVLALAVVVLYLLGHNELALLFGGALLFAAFKMSRRASTGNANSVLPIAWLAAGAHTVPAVAPITLPSLFLWFLKIGGTLYGSGYVLIAFVRNDMVTRLHWITNQQLLDAVSVGQVTPGPVFTTATFIGYVVAGPVGGIVATIGIFLPSFVFVALTSRLIPRLRAWAWSGALLDGINVAALGLMAGVTIGLAHVTFVRAARPDVVAIVIAAVSAVLLVRWKVNSTWLIVGAAALGVALLHW